MYYEYDCADCGTKVGCSTTEEENQEEVTCFKCFAINKVIGVTNKYDVKSTGKIDLKKKEYVERIHKLSKK